MLIMLTDPSCYGEVCSLLVNKQTPQWRFCCDGIGDQPTSIRDTRMREHWPPMRVAKYFATPKPMEKFPTHPASHLIWHFRISPSVVIQLRNIGCVWRPCEVLAQWGQSKSIQSCAIAPRTPRMDSDSRPLRLVKFRIGIRKGTTGVCFEIKDMLMHLIQYTGYTILIFTNAVIIYSLCDNNDK